MNPQPSIVDPAETAFGCSLNSSSYDIPHQTHATAKNRRAKKTDAVQATALTAGERAARGSVRMTHPDTRPEPRR